MRRLSLLLSVAAVTGCSVIGLDDFERCDELGSTVAEQEAACATALNATIGAPENCRPFRCIDGACVEQNVELCDSADNDCDGVVDEEVFAPSEFASVGYENNASNLSVASDGTEARAYWIERTGTAGGDGASAALRPSIDTERTPVSYFTHHPDQTDENRRLPGVGPLEAGCWRRTIDDTGERVSVNAEMSTRCDFSAMETSREGQSTLVASIDGAGCSAGRLRLGHIDAPGQFAVVGPLARSNSFMGVALTPDGDCSAAVPDLCQAARDANIVGPTPPICATSAECGGTGECVCGKCLSPENVAVAIHCGFADFAMDTVEGELDDVQLRGLVAAVSGSQLQARCQLPDFASTPGVDESLRDVVVFGTYLNQQQGHTFVNANDEGAPLVLTPQTSGAKAPGVLGVGDSFIVAYPSPTRTLAVHFIGPPAGLLSTDVTSCEPTPGGVQVCASSNQQAVCQRTHCGSDIGVCTSGAPTCINGDGFCQGQRDPDAVEECDNGQDDDCDGRTDESSCEADRMGMALAETCNAIDDDFDGIVDEDVVGRFTLEQRALLTNPTLPEAEVQVGDPCGEINGTCALGAVACVGGRLVCEGAIVPRRDRGGNPRDLCASGSDDDCDGVVGGACTECEVARERETCDGRDDDCDGRVDEGVPITEFRDLLTDSTSRDLETVRQCAPTPALTSTAAGAEGFPGPFDNVALSEGPRDSEGLNVGMAYREILADGSSHVAFRILKFHVDCTCRRGGTCGESACDELLTPTGTRSVGVPVRLSVTSGNYGSPTLAYAPTGFRAGVGEETGGWYVLWTDDGDIANMSDSTLLGRRVALHDGMPSDPAPFSATMDVSNPQTPFVYSDDFGAGYAFVDERSRQVVSARLFCSADAPR